MKSSPSVLSCIGKRTREGCDRGSEAGEGPVPPRKSKESGREGINSTSFTSVVLVAFMHLI